MLGTFAVAEATQMVALGVTSSSQRAASMLIEGGSAMFQRRHLGDNNDDGGGYRVHNTAEELHAAATRCHKCFKMVRIRVFDALVDSICPYDL